MGNYGSILSTFATLTQVVGSIKAATDAQAIASYNARAADATGQREAIAAGIEATQQERLGLIAEQDMALNAQAQAYREQRQRDQQQRALGTARAIVASSGLMLTGSPLAVYEDTVRQTELDIIAQRYESNLRARALGEEVTQRRYAADVLRYGGRERLRIGGVQAGLLRAQGEEAFTGGLLRAGGQALAGAGQSLSLYEREKAVKEGRVSPTLLGR